MLIEMMKSKIHRVTVTEANLNYIGSITIDKRLGCRRYSAWSESVDRKQQ